VEPTVEVLLHKLKEDPATVELLEVYGHVHHSDLWDKDAQGPRLYRGFARALIDRGYPAFGLKLGRRGLQIHPGDPELLYAVALAHARGGNPTSAEQTLHELLDSKPKGASTTTSTPSTAVRIDAVALRGRLYKDRYRREKDANRRQELARLSADWYRSAADLPGADTFPLVNAATMRRLEGSATQAWTIARQVLERLQPEAERPEQARNFWSQATLGEAFVLLGDHEAGLRHYQRAADLMFEGGQIGALISMLGNLRLLAEAGVTQEPAWLQERLGSVIVFTGHRIDPQHQGKPPRFPQ
jgi:tetratricopeptide (TPR) repeat protein